MRIRDIFIKNIDSTNLFDTFEILKKYKISSMNLISSSVKYYNLLQKGGDENKYISIDSNKYEYP
jgi:hypothetical protein